MRFARKALGAGLGTISVAALILAPALRAQEAHGSHAVRTQPIGTIAEFGSFTPAAADPKLAAVLARSGLPQASFRFTPSESRRSSNAVTLAIRSNSTRTAVAADRANPDPEPVALAPVAYNLGVTVGWKRFELSGDVTHVDLVTTPGGRERTDFGISYNGKRASGGIHAAADRPLIDTPVQIGDMPSYSIDVGGSYRVAKNLDVTAGVRYKAERDRLPRLTDQRRDSQAVYVGTAFRF